MLLLLEKYGELRTEGSKEGGRECKTYHCKEGGNEGSIIL